MHRDERLSSVIGQSPTGRMAPLSRDELVEQALRLLTRAEDALSRGWRAEGVLLLESVAEVVGRLGDCDTVGVVRTALASHQVARARSVLCSAVHRLLDGRNLAGA